MTWWRQSFLVFVGGGTGASARYWLGILFARFAGPGFPWATFTINVSGCLVIGAFLGAAAARFPGSLGWRLLLAVGFCGGYTTFSTFGYELYTFLRDHAVLTAAVYVAVSVGAGVLGVAVGDGVARVMEGPS